MKKILFTAVFILTCLICKAQDKLDSYALQIGHWNNYLEDYTWEDVKPCEISFLLQGDVIMANDAAESVYYTYNNFVHNELNNSWQAFDENRTKCIITMMFGETSYLIVIYNDICYKYFVNI